MNANRSAGAPLSSPAAAQRCAEGAGLDRGVLAAAQSAMPLIAAAPAINADMITTSAAAFDDPSDTVPNLHSLDGRDLFLFFHKRLCGPLANSRFHHRPDTTHQPASKLEAAYHRADNAIQQIVDLLAA